MAARRMACAILLATLVPFQCGTARPPRQPSSESIEIAEFFIGGHYTDDGKAMAGQAHVLYLRLRGRPDAPRVVAIPGLGQTIANFLSTPDGRPGWAQQLVAMGFAVYLMDQPGRGASGYNHAAYGPPSGQTPLLIEQRFTAPEKFAAEPGKPWGWPQARLHTQWPGTGMRGDAAFDQFYASQVESAPGNLSSDLVLDAGVALLDRIGPAVLVTHSQAGAFGWRIGDARADKVLAIVAVEPSGPPFFSAPPPWGDGDPARLSRPYGLTREPISYTPALADPADLKPVQEARAEGPDYVRCWRQGGAPRKLAGLSRFPVLILASQASYHVGYDHCTARYLQQAGVATDFVRLADKGIMGNGHMMMLEKNNGRISALIGGWIKTHVKGRRAR
jgi:pimeloyl-ACP methyl ester carboxylesterase